MFIIDKIIMNINKMIRIAIEKSIINLYLLIVPAVQLIRNMFIKGKNLYKRFKRTA